MKTSRRIATKMGISALTLLTVIQFTPLILASLRKMRTILGQGIQEVIPSLSRRPISQAQPSLLPLLDVQRIGKVTVIELQITQRISLLVEILR